MERTGQPRLRIGSARVGRGAPVYVVAEAGVNHDGELSVARELVHAAAEAGADAVKFQVFAADRLVTRQAPAAAYQQQAVHTESQYEMLARLELTHDEFVALADHVRNVGISFIATPFSVVDLEFLVSIGVPAVKLASTDIVNGPLLESAAQSRLPVIASTGAADEREVAEAVDLVHRVDGGPLALLHCISSYPTDEREANLAAIGSLARTFGCVTGFSDHTESTTIGSLAVAAGACIIEKHFTLDCRRAGPDHSFSLEPDRFAEYVGHIRAAEQIVGDGLIGPAPCEREVRDLARGSVVATRDIRAAELFTSAMLTVKRPGGGLEPNELRRLIGRSAARDISADTPLSWADVAEPALAHAGAP